MREISTVVGGGRFLTSEVDSREVLIRQELSEEQRMFGRTAAEFMAREVLPVVQRLYEHDWALTRQLLRKAAAIDLLRLEIPPEYGGLWGGLISAAYFGGENALHPS